MIAQHERNLRDGEALPIEETLRLKLRRLMDSNSKGVGRSH